MPEVGDKKFDYTKKGKADAKKYAKKTGRKMTGGSKKPRNTSGGSKKKRNAGKNY